MTIRKVYLDGDNQVWFAKVQNVPGFTHRVILNGVAVDWLSSESKPSKATAAFFLAKHDSKPGTN